MRVAILGAGKMGSWLIRALAAAGHELAAYDPSPERLEAAIAGVAGPAGGRPVVPASGVRALAAFGPELLVNCAPLASGFGWARVEHLGIDDMCGAFAAQVV